MNKAALAARRSDLADGVVRPLGIDVGHDHVCPRTGKGIAVARPMPAGPVSRGLARRNAKLKALRELVGKDRAIVAVDLAAQCQAAVVCDHDSVVLARRMFSGSAWCISEILAWSEPVAAGAGFAGLVLACEPTGHRWKPLVVTTRAARIPVVCVQPLLVRRAQALAGPCRGRRPPAASPVGIHLDQGSGPPGHLLPGPPGRPGHDQHGPGKDAARLRRPRKP